MNKYQGCSQLFSHGGNYALHSYGILDVSHAVLTKMKKPKYDVKT